MERVSLGKPTTLKLSRSASRLFVLAILKNPIVRIVLMCFRPHGLPMCSERTLFSER
jgi:hypothetical protein